MTIKVGKIGVPKIAAPPPRGTKSQGVPRPTIPAKTRVNLRPQSEESVNLPVIFVAGPSGFRNVTAVVSVESFIRLVSCDFVDGPLR
jgi:hypothetical protein